MDCRNLQNISDQRPENQFSTPSRVAQTTSNRQDVDLRAARVWFAKQPVEMKTNTLFPWQR
jgi:hypothetical protein